MILLLMAIFSLISQASYGANSLTVRESYNQYALNAYVSYQFEIETDPSPITLRSNDLWKANTSGKPLNFGYNSGTVWLRINLDIPKENQDEWYVVIPYPMLEEAKLYVFEDGKTQPVFEADSRDHSQNRRIQTPYISFQLPVGLHGPVELLLRSHSSTALQIPLELHKSDGLINQQNRESLLWGIYFGVILALIAYNSFLFVSILNRAYLYYVLYLNAIIGLTLCISGYGHLYIWLSSSVDTYMLSISTGLATVFALSFTRAFLGVQGIDQLLLRLMQGVSLAAVMMVLATLAWPEYGALLSAILSMMAVALVIFAGVNALGSGATIARYFVLAWAAFALGATFYLLSLFGFTAVSYFSNHALQVGSALEAILLSFALAHRIKQERQQKLTALEEKHLAEQRMHQAQAIALQQALHDPTTNMPNDSLLLQRIQDLINTRGNYDAFSLVLLYFPQMKEISSSMGQKIAQELFRSVIRDLNRAMSDDPQAIVIESQPGNFVSVIEFGSLVALCAQGSPQDSLHNFIQRYLCFYDGPIDIDGISVSLHTSCGIACYPKHGDRAEILLQHANAARDFGLRTRERMTIYSSEIEAFGRRRLTLVGALAQAIRNQELDIYLQPQVSSHDQRVVGAEVLLRWSSPLHGIISPKEFIGIAEDAGMMAELTRYVVQKALSTQQHLQQIGLLQKISINLSVHNLTEPGFVTFLQKEAAAHQVDLQTVVLEVTESAMSEKMEHVIESLQQLAAQGCDIALDDFGTGYSSLAYLSRLPIHELKIDQSFISQMSNSTSDLRIVENTIKLARALGLETVAEGVEDHTTLELLQRLGCDRIQGYYLAKPMPIPQFINWLQQRHPALVTEA